MYRTSENLRRVHSGKFVMPVGINNAKGTQQALRFGVETRSYRACMLC